MLNKIASVALLLNSANISTNEFVCSNRDGTVRFVLPKVQQIAPPQPLHTCKTPEPPPRNTKNLLHFDFEQPTLDQNGLFKSGYPPTLSTGRAYTGQQSLVSYLDYNRRNDNDRTHVNHQSEVGIKQRTERRWTQLQYNQEQWFGFAVLLDDGEYTEPQYEHILFKIHSNPERGERRSIRHPVFTFGITGAKDSVKYGVKQPTWRFSIVGDSRRIVPARGRDKRYQSRNGGTAGAAMVDRGRWVRWVINIKTSYNPDGHLRVWKDGKQVFTKMGIRTAFNDRKPPYIRFGQYNWNWRKGLKLARSNPPVTKVYFDDVRIAYGQHRYKDVAP